KTRREVDRPRDRPGTIWRTRTSPRRPRRAPPRRARPSRSAAGPAATSGSAGAPGSLLRKTEHVPHAAYGVDQRRGGRDVDLLPQVVDVRLDDVRLALEVVVPHVIEDLGLRQHPARVGEQEPQQVVFRGRELDRTLLTSDLVRVVVE